jgi:dTDP-4-dehydrorhamnose reductase
MRSSFLKWAVLGSAGQLGSDLCPRLPGQVTALTRARADLTRSEQMRQTLQDLRPDVVINCAAYNLVDQAEQEPEAAFAVNAWGLRQLALVCRDLDCALVHFGSDYVFGLDEARRTPYAETDAPGPVGVYGLSKLAGEYLVRSVCPKHFVLRTCGLYGARGQGGKGGNFVETMLRLGKAGKPLRVVDDQICTPSSTVDIASAAAQIVLTERFGLYHITNAGCCSWFEFAKYIFDEAKVQANLSATSSKEYGAAARRPSYSVLADNKLEEAGIPRPRSWQEAVSEYLREREVS